MSDGHGHLFNNINLGGRGGTDATFSWKIMLVFQTLGVVFGDVGTSPLYTFSVMYSKALANGNEDVLGAFFLVLYTLILIPLIKWVPSPELERSLKIKKRLEALVTLKKLLLMLVLAGTSMVIADGIVTPAMSVISAVGGLRLEFQDKRKGNVGLGFVFQSKGCSVFILSVFSCFTILTARYLTLNDLATTFAKIVLMFLEGRKENRVWYTGAYHALGILDNILHLNCRDCLGMPYKRKIWSPHVQFMKLDLFCLETLKTEWISLRTYTFRQVLDV